MKELDVMQKTITIEDAAYFIRMHPERLRNLIKRGDYADIGESVQGLDGSSRMFCFIRPKAFLEKYALTWEDIFEARRKRIAEENQAAG